MFICGISALPPVYLQALQALGKHIEIHLLFTNPCRYYWGDIKDPAYLAKLLARQRRHSFEDRHLPLFHDNANAESLFNGDGEQDVGNPMLASWGKLGRDYIYLLSELENSQSWMRLSTLRRITCCITSRPISLSWKTAQWRA